MLSLAGEIIYKEEEKKSFIECGKGDTSKDKSDFFLDIFFVNYTGVPSIVCGNI